MKKETTRAFPTVKINFWMTGLLITVLTAAFASSVFTQSIAPISSDDADQTDKPSKDNNSVDRNPKPKIVQKVEQISSNELITATTYVFSTQNAIALEDMSSGTTQLIASLADDAASPVTNIGFDFWYDGVRYTQFSASSNGVAGLGPVAVTTTFTNDLDTATTSPKIAPYFEDLCTSNGNVRSKVVGSAPNRKLIIEWNNVQVSQDVGCLPAAGNGTFQLWLFESVSTGTTPGGIQFVYGALPVPAPGDGGYSVGIQAGVATNVASVTTSTDTVVYGSANDANATAITAGKSYLFTPNIPAAPTGLTFGTSTGTTNTLNWTDNATNEVGYVIYRSTDAVNYSFITQIAAGSVSYTDTLLTPNTGYFYRVFAVTEGALSTPPLTGSQSTTLGGSDTCAGAGGDYSNPATWLDGSVPTANDNVTIQSGCTVIVDTATAVALNVTTDFLGTLSSPTAGVVTTNNLTVGGNVTINGLLDFSTNGDTSGAILTMGAGGFDVALNQGGLGTIDVREIVVAKGAQATIVELQAGVAFTVRGVTTDVAGYLTITSGTFKISGVVTMTNRTFLVAGYTIPTAGGFWLNSPNYTVAAQNGSPAVTGLLRVTQGIFNVGTAAGNSLTPGTNGQINIEGGTVNITGRLQSTSTGISYTQSGGTVNTCTIANTAATACFGLTSSTNTFNWISGTIILTLPSANAAPLDWSVSTLSTLITNPAGTTLQLGTGATVETYRVLGNTPSILIGATKTMNVGAGAAGGAIFFRGTTVTNNGVIAAQGTGGSSRFDWAASGAMSYGGTGTFGTAVTPFGGVGMSANSPTANNTTINSPIILNRVNIFNGGFTNSSNITFGNGAASTTVIQVGNSTTPTNAGTFDVSPIYLLGTGGHIVLHLRVTPLNRNTGFEIPGTRSLAQLTYDNNAVGATLTVTGGNLTVATWLLTNGVINTSAANLMTHNGVVTRAVACLITSCYVDGPLRREYAAIGAYTYHVGENGYSPVLANVTATSFGDSASPSGNPHLTAEAFDATLAGMNPPTSLTRNWSLLEVGSLTADLSFTYNTDAADVPVTLTEANLRVWRRDTIGNNPTFTDMCGAPCVNTATNTMGPVVGVTQFSRWGGGDAAVVVAANVNVGGRVTAADGIRGLGNVQVTISGGGLLRTITTNPFGYYNFEDLEVGRTYVLTVGAKQYTFTNPTIVITPDDNIGNADFIGAPLE